MIINQDKLEFICELLISKIKIENSSVKDSDSILHLYVTFDNKKWYLPLYKSQNNISLFKIQCDEIEIYLKDLNKTEIVNNLEKILLDCVKYNNDKSDEEFIKLFPSYKERLRDHKINTINS